VKNVSTVGAGVLRMVAGLAYLPHSFAGMQS
jgi:hypothetical protein